MLAVIDNYDSFTFNLVQALGMLGAEVRVWRNDEVTVSQVLAEEPAGIVISPGPCGPEEAGISLELMAKVHRCAQEGKIIPVLGVCLGHQVIGSAFGCRIVKAPVVVHGKPSSIYHSASTLLSKLDQGFQAGRYHSLMIDPETMSEVLKVTAQTEDGLIMAIEHKDYPFFGLQFHPESVLTPDGMKILDAFLDIVKHVQH